ncbi:serum/glucocorticoid-regulated kinase 2 [Nematocida sp. LUAm3]|nr:serum/glucocorticoid-regulated kinase 2 [Nematocida sp. LUAm3]KAI5173672.1 serum/glucocorticoid-regulated kinase 2 [Nematocida sp. LUAm2]KAI5176893.1 serum/glucocorticoid-regulated kinase 2 [Nematocida sp. LUAm1]
MNALRRAWMLLFPRKKMLPTEMLGTVKTTLIRTMQHSKAQIEFKGHKSTLTAESPKSVFDIFKHGSLYIRIGHKNFHIKTQSILKEMEVEKGGVIVLVEFTAYKKKLGVDDFLFLRLLGKGAYGRVVLVKHKITERLYACKIIKKTKESDSIEKMVNEKNILAQISSPFLIYLLASFQTEDKVYLILPYIEGGELFHHLQKVERFNEELAKIYIAELLLAVEHLHTHGIIYRDIKPENVLLDRDGHVVLCDFGLSIQNEMASTYCGTPEYMAPEIIKNEQYMEAVDYYTLGVLLYEMVSGYPPFFTGEGEDKEDLENKILFSDVTYKDDLSFEIKDLISCLLRKCPEKRPKIFEIKSHSFFQGFDWEKAEKKEYVSKYIPLEERNVEEDLQDSLDHQTETYQGIIPGFTYCADDWEEDKNNSPAQSKNKN